MQLGFPPHDGSRDDATMVQVPVDSTRQVRLLSPSRVSTAVSWLERPLRMAIRKGGVL